LKMIRKAMVGKINRLRMVISVSPRTLAADLRSSLMIAVRRSLADPVAAR